MSTMMRAGNTVGVGLYRASRGRIGAKARKSGRTMPLALLTPR